jgi:gas vesicle protein GvpA/GvpJ/GvpM family
MFMPQQSTSLQTTNLAELLERILDKGVVIVGDIKINLLDVELLTIKIRLLIASVDKAKAIGINWWEEDSFVKAPRQTMLDTESSNGDGTRVE